jgi:hypothetical protein
MSPVNSIIKDKTNRRRFEKPKSTYIKVVNHSHKFNPVNAQTHANELSYIYKTQLNPIPAILGLIVDNGPDYSPSSWLVMISFGRLWRDLNLDILIIMSHAPYNSKYNPIERVWGKLTKDLARVTLVPDYIKFNLKSLDEIKILFQEALMELQKYWAESKYDEIPIVIEQSSPKNSDYEDYAELKKLNEDISANKVKSDLFLKYRLELDFIIKHCIKRNYYLQFTKCLNINCSHCQNNIRMSEPLTLLNKLDEGALPVPILLDYQDGEQHYVTLLEIIEIEHLLNKMKQEKKIKDKNNKHKCNKCYYFAKSLTDLKKHKIFCS